MPNFPLFHLVQREQHLYQLTVLPFPVRLGRKIKQDLNTQAPKKIIPRIGFQGEIFLEGDINKEFQMVMI